MSAFLITSGTCLMTFGGGMIALRLDAYRGFVLAFAAGALVSSALLDVIPDALELLTRSGSLLHHHQLMFTVCLGFLAFYLLEQSTHADGDAHRLDVAPTAGLAGALGIGLH